VKGDQSQRETMAATIIKNRTDPRAHTKKADNGNNIPVQPHNDTIK
jgi:hypothetical protein